MLIHGVFSQRDSHGLPNGKLAGHIHQPVGATHPVPGIDISASIQQQLRRRKERGCTEQGAWMLRCALVKIIVKHCAERANLLH